ncbi:endonuclease/exonuclease/phosphatase family protein [Artemisia annua]|uniref:Endonuclease/exonuclease/phosphatase family protein n=1 Tax=Artemisia annua TaxID=35608 RepID=A0A2U1MW68_ARTAN|nr:endonuclease/exonuclease/phosphatase family protein [Artemisia annua]
MAKTRLDPARTRLFPVRSGQNPVAPGYSGQNPAITDNTRLYPVRSGQDPVIPAKTRLYPAKTRLDPGKTRLDPVAVDVDGRGSHDKKSTDKALVTSDETWSKVDVKTLKILSYNIWFAEDVEIHIRMRTIGDIIQLHSPDVICLQEVTANIYAIFQRPDWWKSYKCSLSFDKANTS